jgi:hypothetical protein
MCCYDDYKYCCDFGMHNSCIANPDDCPIKK